MKCEFFFEIEMLDKAEDLFSDLEDQAEKNTQYEEQKQN